MHIQSKEKYLGLNPSQIAASTFFCPDCGRIHSIPFREVSYGAGIMRGLPDIIERCLGHKPKTIGVIFDNHIKEIIEPSLLDTFTGGKVNLRWYPLGAQNQHLEPTNRVGQQTAASIEADIEILIGMGSGVICDLTKYIADIKNLPFILCGTANSMNAYTSMTGIITENKFKVSKFLKVADAILLDTDILSAAPVEMTLAGIGDLSARTICNADFRLSHLMRKTWFCPFPHQLTQAYEDRYLSVADKIGKSEPEAIETLSQANIISGYSMTMLDGETFPSSGAEHVFSHFLDLQHELYGAQKNLHGTQVGFGTLINLALYDFLRNFKPHQFNISKIISGRKSLVQIQIENETLFGSASEDINKVVEQKWLQDDVLESNLRFLFLNWEEIWIDLSHFITPPKKIQDAFSAANFPTSIAAINRSESEILDAILFGNRYRTRFTILDLMWDLGLFPDAAKEILVQSTLH